MICLFFSLTGYAQNEFDLWEFDKDLTDAYTSSINLKIDESRDKLSNYENKSHYGLIYLQNLNDAVEIFITENEQAFEIYLDQTDQYLETLENAPSSPFKGFYISEIKIRKTFLHLKFGEELSGAWTFRQAYRTIMKNMDQYPDFVYNYKTAGLTHVIIGSVPEKHKWLLSLFGFKGSIRMGLEELQLFSNTDTPFTLESDVLLAFIFSYLMDNNNAAIQVFNSYQDEVYSNLLMNYAYSSVLIKDSKSEEALGILGNFKITQDQIPFPFRDYQIANILLQKGEYSGSIKFFKQFLNEHSGMNYIKDANYKIGLNYWLLDDHESAQEYFELAKITGLTLMETDKYASRAIGKNISNTDILKIRMLTDGGYYRKAWQIVNNISENSFSSKIDNVEFIYRKARLYDKSGEIENAVQLYERTIQDSKEESWYFAPNSALQLGYYYKSISEPEKAREYFKLALSYRNHPYKNSIDNKAKAAMSGLE